MVKAEIKVGEEYAASFSGWGKFNQRRPARVKVLELDHEHEVEICSSWTGNPTGRFKTEKSILVEVIADSYGQKPKKAERKGYIKDGRYFFSTWTDHADFEQRVVKYREEQDKQRKREYEALDRIRPILKAAKTEVPDYDTDKLTFTPTRLEKLIKAVKGA